MSADFFFSSDKISTKQVNSSQLQGSQFTQAENGLVLPYPICNAIITWLTCSSHYEPHFLGFVLHP